MTNEAAIETGAKVAETVVQDVMKVEPTVATIASMFLPEAAPVVAMVQPEVMLAAPFIENALKALASGNNGDVLGSFVQLLQHLTPGQPNSPILDSKPSITAESASTQPSA